MAKNAKRTVRLVNTSSEINTLVANVMKNNKEDNKAMLSFVGYMMSNPQNYGPSFVSLYDKTEGKDRTVMINTYLANISADYAGIASEAKKLKEQKGKTENQKVELHSLTKQIDAAHMLFKRSVQSIAYLQSIKAKNYKVQLNGACFTHMITPEGKKPTETTEIMTGATLITKGTALLRKGKPGRGSVDKKAGEQAGAASVGITLRQSIDFAAKSLVNEKGKAMPLSLENEQAVDKMLTRIIERRFVQDGEVKSEEVVRWIRQHLAGVKVDGKAAAPLSAVQAEALKNSRVPSSTPRPNPSTIKEIKEVKAEAKNNGVKAAADKAEALSASK